MKKMEISYQLFGTIMPAYNWRLGASGAVSLLGNWYDFCKEFLCRNGVEAPPPCQYAKRYLPSNEKRRWKR